MLRRQPRRRGMHWRAHILCWMAGLLLAVMATPAAAQTSVGQVSGTVTDSSRGVLPGVTVTVTNDETQVSRSDVTNDRGGYVVTNLLPGRYTIAAELTGFKKITQGGFVLVADGRLTADFSLSVGDVTETINVAAVTGESINRTSGEIARVVDSNQVQKLALNARNYLQLASLIPGSAQLDFNPLAATTGLGTSLQAVNGNRGNTNNLNVDGVYNLQSGSNNSMVNNVGIDFIQEVKLQTSNFSAEYGRNSGASINVVTKSGTNEFRGSVFEYLRNDKLDAKDFFAARKGKLRFNDYGGAVGGPIQKGKLFFFGGVEYKKIRQEILQRATLPTRAMRSGDFSGLSTQLVFPGTNTPIPNNDISALITPEGRSIARVYDAMEGRATGFDNRNVGNNTTFQEPNPFNWREIIARVDYRISDRHSVYYRLIWDSYELLDPFGTFLGSNVPTTPTLRRRPSPNNQVNYTWIVTPSLISESKVSATWLGQRIPPEGDLWQRATYGFSYPQIFEGGGRFDNSIPNVDIQGFANWRGASGSLLSPTTDIGATQTLTYLRGAHTFKGGVSVIRNRLDQNGRSNYAGFVNFNTAGNTRTTGNAFADALLGNFRTYSEANGDPIGFFRFTQVDAFITDNWRLGSKLTVDVGVRYQYAPAMYTQANHVTNFDPALYDPARAVTMLPNGTIVPGSGNRFNGLIRAGDGVPDDQRGRVPGVDSPEIGAVPTGAPRGLYDSAHAFAPRVGFAWTPFDNAKTSVRGGFGMFYDRPEGNIFFSSVNMPPFLQTVAYDNGNLANPGGGTPSVNAPFSEIQVIDPELVAPRTYQYSVSVQRELPRGFFVEVAYVGNRGRNLIWQPDINQPTFEQLAANQLLPANQRLAVNAMRPYKGYSQIRQRRSDAVSNYHAMQLYATKRAGDLQLTASYTLSRVLTNASGINDNPEDPFNLDFNYGPASFDRRHVAVFTYTYALPFFRERGGVLGAALGGWEISGITRFQSGQYFTITGDTSIGNRRADYLGGDVQLPESERTVRRWFNTGAFAVAPVDRRGNATVGQVQGPGVQLWDMSLRKRFDVTERIDATFIADVFNAFNMVNFTGIGTNISAANFGTITTAAPARNIQLGLKLAF